MLKIWLAAGLAAIVAVITIVTGFLNQARFIVILYRTVISLIISGCIGYAAGVFFQRVWLPYLLRKNIEKEQSVMKAEVPQTEENPEEAMNENTEKTEFAPFTAENLNRVSPPNS